MQSPARWKIRLLGGLSIEQAGRVVVRFRTQNTGALLGYLAFHLHQAHPREALIDMLWRDASPETGRHNLSMALSFLRDELGHSAEFPVLQATRHTVQLNPALVEVDALEFQALHARLEVAPAEQRMELLSQLTALYQGELMRGYYQDWITPQAVSLESAYVQGVQLLIQLLDESRQTEQALQTAIDALKHIPLHEGLHLEAMRLMAALGQYENALRQYDHCARLLQEHYQSAPSETMRNLAAQIRASKEQTTAPQGHTIANGAELDAALEWSFAHSPEHALMLVLSLTPLWDRQMRWEQGAHWLEHALRNRDLEPTTRAHLLQQMALFAFRRGAYEQAELCLREAATLFRKNHDGHSIARLLYLQARVAEAQARCGAATTLYQQARAQLLRQGDEKEVASLLSSLGRLLMFRGRYEEAHATLQEAVQTARQTRDPLRESAATHNLAFYYLWLGQPQQAQPLYETALEIRLRAGEQLFLSALYNGMGRLHLALGDPQQAVAYCLKGLEIRRAVGDRPGMAHSCCFLGRAYLERSEWTLAESYYQQGLDICREYGNRPYEALCLEGLSVMAFNTGQTELARQRMSDAARIRQTYGLPAPPLDHPLVAPLAEAFAVPLLASMP
ncbi:MAG: tetratricopeptide repeat protein [Fimbriimonadales bacterium]|nr:tetratricopeptide repeat protein [Fimbriimonadales bacterium]